MYQERLAISLTVHYTIYYALSRTARGSLPLIPSGLANKESIFLSTILLVASELSRPPK